MDLLVWQGARSTGQPGRGHYRVTVPHRNSRTEVKVEGRTHRARGGRTLAETSRCASPDGRRADLPGSSTFYCDPGRARMLCQGIPAGRLADAGRDDTDAPEHHHGEDWIPT